MNKCGRKVEKRERYFWKDLLQNNSDTEHRISRHWQPSETGLQQSKQHDFTDYLSHKTWGQAVILVQNKSVLWLWCLLLHGEAILNSRSKQEESLTDKNIWMIFLWPLFHFTRTLDATTQVRVNTFHGNFPG